MPEHENRLRASLQNKTEISLFVFVNSSLSLYNYINIGNSQYLCLLMDPFFRLIIVFSRDRAILKENKYCGTHKKFSFLGFF